MIVDARGIRDRPTIDADVAVIGADPAGITLARKLGDVGVGVALFESGGQACDPDAQPLHGEEKTAFPYRGLDVARPPFLCGTSNHCADMVRPLDGEDFPTHDWMPLSGWPAAASGMRGYFRKTQEILDLGPSEYEADDWLGRIGDKWLGYKRLGQSIKSIRA